MTKKTRHVLLYLIMLMNLTQRHTVTKYETQDPTAHCAQETHFRFKDTQSPRVKDGKGIPSKRQPKESRGGHTCIRIGDSR